jgi:hypothetical protein
MDETVLLGESRVLPQCQFDMPPLDRHQVGAQRRHHRLPGKTRPHPGPHDLCGLCLLVTACSTHQPILSG